MDGGTAAKVLMIPELLENVLLHLVEQPSKATIKQLFSLQHVDTRFLKTIKSSRKLRRVMLLEGSQQEVPEEDRRENRFCYELTDGYGLNHEPILGLSTFDVDGTVS